jgi:hypothetical protein
MSQRSQSAYAHLKVRMKEPLRAVLEQAARERGVSMNAEIVARLERSFEEEERFGGSAMSPIVSMLAGAFKRGGELGKHARQHPEWTTSEWLADPICYRAAAYAVADALNLPGPDKASMSDPAAVHELLTSMVAGGAPMRVTKGSDK